ncbi:aspartate aminotransferase family protein [Dactylosporangium roseum]|uniref:Aspartate aminotransferase family protein n=1 Tax=Dactylosporangium roseum TaxID=47989 RepID=A0ABY5ZEY2_9ACTN|nr:aspartate aminotransferase family protein [Dactylosporangium roseum]UWZ39312.1 aspartate aminotransferase family protein [Dactylosporangium roseum]
MLVKGTGCYVTDQHGREYLDASSPNLTCGYAVPEVAHAVGEQASRMHGYDLSVASHDTAGALAERVAGLMPADLSRTLLTNSGTEAVEAALLIAGMYAGLRGDPRTRVVTFATGYHGSTVLARSLSGLAHLDHPFHQPMPVTRVTLPSPAREMRSPEALDMLLAAFRAALAGDGQEPPLAVVVEPLINVGGGVVLPPGFLSGLRRLCDEYGALLILDEVSTGYGRTGRMFAFEHEGVVADIVVTSKGLAGGYAPISAVSVRESIYTAFGRDPFVGGLRFGQTTSGHGIACAAALATLDLLVRDDLAGRAQRLGEVLMDALRELAGTRGVADVRGMGLFVSLEFEDETTAVAVVTAAQQRGLLLRRQGAVVMAVPPLTIDETTLDLLVERIRSAVREVAA